MTNPPDAEIVETLLDHGAELRGWNSDPLDQPVQIYVDTWLPRLADHPDAAERLQTHIVEGDSSRRVAQFSRHDLVSAAERATSTRSDDDLTWLLVACQTWGSGRSNGRGPRYLSDALADTSRVPTLTTILDLVELGSVGEAYQQRLAGWGPSFVTKFMYALAAARVKGTGRHPSALILDDRVWAALGAMGWDSRVEAGSKRWKRRYPAYVHAMSRWADALDVRADVVERLLFERREHVTD